MRRELRIMLAGLVVAGAFVVGAAGTAQAACEPDKVATKYPGLAGKTLKVGLDPTLPPVMYRDPNNPSKIIGQDPDMVDAAMKCLGLKYELVGLDFGTLIPTLQAGQIQLVWSNIYYTPVRGPGRRLRHLRHHGDGGHREEGQSEGHQEHRRHVRHARRAHPGHGGGSGIQGPEHQVRGRREARHRDHAIPECAGDLPGHRERPRRRVDVRPRARRPGREEQPRQVRARVLVPDEHQDRSGGEEGQ